MNKAILIAALVFASCSAFAETVNTARLNVRSAPSMSGTVTGTLQQGTEVTVYERKNGWTKIHPTKSRWVSSKLLSENDTNNETPVLPLVIFVTLSVLAWAVIDVLGRIRKEQQRQQEIQEENQRRQEAEQAEQAYRAAQAEQERQRKRQEESQRRRAEAEARQAEDLKAARENRQQAQGKSEEQARQERSAEIARLRKRVSALHPDKGGPGGNAFKEAKDLLDKVLRECREGG